MKYWAQNIKAIADSVALTLYGACISASLLPTFFLWLKGDRLLRIVGPAENAMCWPYFPDCFAHRPDRQILLAALSLYAALTIAAIALFALSVYWRKKSSTGASLRLVNLGCLALLCALAVKALIMLQDFRLTGDYHYVTWVIGLAFLFLPEKLATANFLMVAIYFAGGLLKFDAGWLSGAYLFGSSFGLSGKWLEIGCLVVVLIETWLVWLLLANRRILFWPTYILLVLFHLLSILAISFEFPLVMLCLLAIFPLSRFANRPPLLRQFLTGTLPRNVYVTLIAFLAIQMFPRLLSSEPSVSGEGRIFSLILFDNKVTCASSILAEFDDRTISLNPISLTREIRLRCDPIVYWNHGRNLCRRMQSQRGFRTLSLYLQVSTPNHPESRPLLRLDDFCKDPPKYNLFSKNSWILQGL